MAEGRPDVVAARGRMRSRGKVRRELADLPGRLSPDETVLALAQAVRNSQVGLLALTDRRLIWLLIGPLRMYLDVEDFPLGRVAGVRFEAGPFSGLVTVEVGPGRSLKYERVAAGPLRFGVNNADGERLVDRAVALLPEATAGGPPGSAGDGTA